MIREVHPVKFALCVSAVLVLAATVFDGGVWGGDQSDKHYDAIVAIDGRLDAIEKYLTHGTENPIGISVFCRTDDSDWATIRMANEIGKERDIPVFIHGNCLTHKVVDIPTEDNLGTEGGKIGEPKPTMCMNGKEYTVDAVTSGKMADGSDEITMTGDPIGDCHGIFHEIENVPQPEGR
jgi:hypothetical protein